MFDGLVPHVAGAGRGNFNHRFAQPSRDAQPMSAILYATDLYPFADLPLRDPISGRSEGLLDRAIADGVAPKVFYTNTSYEYWSRAASLVHTTPDGRADAPVQANARVYFYTGLQHFSGPFPPERGSGDAGSAYRQSPLPVRWFWRAMLVNLDAWVKRRRRAAGEPLPAHRRRHARAAAVARVPEAPRRHAAAGRAVRRRDRLRPASSREASSRGSRPSREAAYPCLVPQVDDDGNEVAGVRLPEQLAPLATYTGWNLRDAETGAPWARVSFLGSYFPFAKDEPARAQSRRPAPVDRRTLRRTVTATSAGTRRPRSRWRTTASCSREDVPAILQQGLAEWDEAAR